MVTIPRHMGPGVRSSIARERPVALAHPPEEGADPVPSTLLLSVIVPTRNEAGNVPLLLERLRPVLANWPSEVIFVDDSSDDTPDVIRQERESYDLPVHLIHRPAGSREGGLGGAVLKGMSAAKGTLMVVMDGDLQHPPEVIPDMVAAAINDERDLVVANRYCEGGSAGSFSLPRLLMSKGSTYAAKALFPSRLRAIDDPMTGFFLARRDALDLSRLRPNGFKILLEIAARTPNLRVGSVPFVFGERHAGESKASFREGMRFLSLLCTLRFGPGFTRFASFGAVGLSGLLVNTLLLAFWTDTVGLYYMFSLLLATQGSSLWNFFLSEHVVFGSTHRREGEVGRAAMFLIMNNIALLARGPIVFVLTSMIGMNYLMSNVISMIVLLVARYALADSIIWKPRPAPAMATLAPVEMSTAAGQTQDGEAYS